MAFYPKQLHLIPVGPGETAEGIVAAMQAKYAAIKPHRGGTDGHRKAQPRALENAGHKALTEGHYQTTAKARPCVLRIWYVSAGGEVLVTHSEPMTHSACENARGNKGTWLDCYLHVETTSVYAAEGDGDMIGTPLEVDAAIRARGLPEIDAARRVVFPAQRSEAVQTTIAEEAPAPALTWSERLAAVKADLAAIGAELAQLRVD